MEGDRWIIYVGIALACVVFAWLRSRSFHQGRLEGIRKAVLDLSRTCSFHYETKDQPLPEKVDKALDYMANAMKRGEGTKGKIFLYLTGAAMLGDAMGEAAWQKGFDAGRLWTEPSEGEKRLDLTPREIRDLAYLAHLGFERVIHGLAHDGFKSAADAEHASEAIRRVESQQPPIISDDPYAFAFNRQTMIWERFRSA